MYVRYRHTHNCLHRHVCRYHICIYDTYAHILVYNWVQVRIYGVYTYRHVYDRVVLSRTMNQLACCACICVCVHRNGTHCASSLYVWVFNLLDIFSYIWSMYVLYVCMNLCTHICMFVCMHAYLYICTNINDTYAYICILICIRVYLNEWIFDSAWTLICIYMCIHTSMIYIHLWYL